jgi:hypothetical protein
VGDYDERQRTIDEQRQKDADEYWRGQGGISAGSPNNQAGPGRGRTRSGGGGGSCFAPWTRVLTVAGDREVQDIQAGELIVSYDPASGRLAARTVSRRHDHAEGRLWHIVTCRDPRPIAVTRWHSFLTHRGWVWAWRLRAGEELVSGTGRPSVVRSVIRTAHVSPVYNLTTQREHTFIADGFVVHNYSFFRRTRSWMDRSHEAATPVDDTHRHVDGRVIRSLSPLR